MKRFKAWWNKHQLWGLVIGLIIILGMPAIAGLAIAIDYATGKAQREEVLDRQCQEICVSGGFAHSPLTFYRSSINACRCTGSLGRVWVDFETGKPFSSGY